MTPIQGKACSVEGKQCIARALYGINNEIYGRCGFSGFHYYRVVGDDVRMHARREGWLLTSVVWSCGTSRCLSPVELRVVCVFEFVTHFACPSNISK